MVSEWWLAIAVSLKVSSGVSLIKLAKLYMCMQTHYKARPWFRTAEPLGERRYKNWIIHTCLKMSLQGTNKKWLLKIYDPLIQFREYCRTCLKGIPQGQTKIAAHGWCSHSTGSVALYCCARDPKKVAAKDR